MLPLQYRYLAAAALVVAVVFGVLHYGSGRYNAGAKAGAARVQALRDADTIKAQQAALQAQDAARKQEQLLTQQLQEAQRALEIEREQSARMAIAARRYRTELGGLRDQLAVYAAGGVGGASQDTITACRDRAQTIAALLDEALRVSEESAADGERCEAGLRAVLMAWPGEL